MKKCFLNIIFIFSMLIFISHAMANQDVRSRSAIISAALDEYEQSLQKKEMTDVAKIGRAMNTLANKISGSVGVEARGFFYDPVHPHQEHGNGSVYAQPEFYHEFKDGSSFTFVPFGRLDSTDKERTHIDVRELHYLWLKNKWEVQVGVGKIFWGAAESVHLVDIINQTDLVEAIDGEEKLGQPMVRLSYARNQSNLEFFLLPYFRERTFPGKNARLRRAEVVDKALTEYENSKEQEHLDAAVRFSQTIGNLDYGLSYFRGIGREPNLRAGTNDSGETILIPRYEIIEQAGLDLQFVMGQWLWKGESIFRSGEEDGSFYALATGFEYTFSGVTKNGMDIGFLAEWLYDDRGKTINSVFDNDVMVGLRLALNDAASTQALLTVTQDIDNKGRVVSLESSRRLGEHWKINLDSYIFLDSSEGDIIHPVRRDDYVELKLGYHF